MLTSINVQKTESGQRLDKFIYKDNAYDGISTRPYVNIIKKLLM